ncbi:hypothetical protein BT96DRAFT_880095, partial [Gymnopus androsaceus JB14]
SPEIKAEYVRRADAAKYAHFIKYPGYKFTPRSRKRVQEQVEKCAYARPPIEDSPVPCFDADGFGSLRTLLPVSSGGSPS